MARHTQLKKSAGMLARSLDHLAETFIASEELRPFETLSLMVGAELIRTVSPMRLAEAIQQGRKKFEALKEGGK